MSVSNAALATAVPADAEISPLPPLIKQQINSEAITMVAATTLEATNRVALPLGTGGELAVTNAVIDAASCSPTTPAVVIPVAPTAGLDCIAAAGSPPDGGLGLSLMQSSPPPHSYRHSRAYRHFKNPPQPHMCIRTTTDTGEELFINVLSWTRIVIPQEPSDPIPLYGGMRVPPGSPRSPPIVFAVMANPEVLKDSGRHSKDPEERRAMVELMCDFVEAMNPGVKLVRNAVILKDRDISGELKDVWNAVQAQRDREREEQMMQQRQQQHYHNITTQQMFPKSADEIQSPLQQKFEEEVDKTSTDKESSAITSAPVIAQQSDNRAATERQNVNTMEGGNISTRVEASPLAATSCNEPVVLSQNSGGEDVATIQHNGNESSDQIDANSKAAAIIPAATKSKVVMSVKNNVNSKISVDNPLQNANHKTVATPMSPTSPTSMQKSGGATPATNSSLPAATTVAAVVTPPTKKEKLGGFLPNGCIFPRFKNNRHKDKDKESKSKEKTLLNALKKSKDKKVAPLEQAEKSLPEADAKTQYEKNCINLENEVQKLDLNKIDAAHSNDTTSMFIKLKVAATSAAAK